MIIYIRNEVVFRKLMYGLPELSHYQGLIMA